MSTDRLRSTDDINREVREAMHEIASCWPYRHTNHEGMRKCRIEMTAKLLTFKFIWPHRIPEFVDFYAGAKP